MKKSVKRSRRAIIVLGMHRSGTSALMRVLNLLGVDLGDNLILPMPENNEKGFWEHMDIYPTNEKLLQDLGSSWDDVRALPDKWWTSDFAEAYKLEIISILERDFSNSPFWGVKDPRICRFLPVWCPLLEQTGSKPYFLIIVRNPLEVVSSLAKRDGFSKGKSCLLWLKHLIESEKGTRNSSRIFVTYEELLSDWKGLMSRVQRFFRFRWPNTLKKAGPEIDAFLENSLRHNRVTDSVLIKDKSLSKWIKDAYLAVIDTIPNGDSRLIKTLDAIETELKETAILYEPAFTEIWKKYLNNNDRLQERNQQVNDIKIRIEELSQEKRNLQSSIDHLHTYAKEKNEHIQQLDVRVKDLTPQLAERDETVKGLSTQLAERDETVKGLSTKLAERDEKVKGLSTKLAERDETVKGLSTQLAERDETVKGLSTQLAERDEKVKGLSTKLAERDETVKGLSTQLAERDEKVKGLSTKLAERNETVKGLSAQLAERDAQLVERDGQLHEIDSSKVWRVVMFLQRLQLFFFPPRSWRARIAKKTLDLLTSPIRMHRNYKTKKDPQPIHASGLFDSNWYLEENPDVETAGIEAFDHFMTAGWKEERNPSPLFDTKFYLDNNPDVKAAGINPLLHYIQFGKAEGRGIKEGEAGEGNSDRYKKPFLTRYQHKIKGIFRLFRQAPRLVRQFVSLSKLYGVIFALGKVKSKLRSETTIEKIHFGTKLLPDISPVDDGFIFISHDASATGAPINLLSQCKAFKEVYGGDFIIILLAGGVLLKEFRAVRETICLNMDMSHITLDERVDTLFAQLKELGFSNCIANTVVSGAFSEILDKNYIETIYQIHELPSLIKSSGFVKYAESIAKSNSTIVCAANYVADKFVANFGASRDAVSIIPQGVRSSMIYEGTKDDAKRKLQEKLGLPPSKDIKIVLGVGYAHKRKGTDLFFDVAKKLFQMKSLENIHFLWLGARNNFFEHWRKNPLPTLPYKTNIHFLDFEAEPAYIFAAADLFLLSSREDPFPSVALEAIANDAPVIVFKDTGGIEEILDGANGKVVSYLDTQEMARETIKTLSENGRCSFSKTKLNTYPDFIKTIVSLLQKKNIFLEKHKVSVIIPNYNYAEYLDNRLRSVIDQKYKPSEIIFLDDASTDNSADVAENSLKDTSIPCKIITNKKNQGVFAQWIKGISEANYDYVWIAEADDIATTDFLSTLMKAFRDKDTVLAYCQPKQIDENSEPYPEYHYADYVKDLSKTKWSVDYSENGVFEISNYLAIKNTIPNVSGVVLKKEALDGVGKYLTDFRYAGDWLVYLYALRKGKIAYFSKIMNYHRRHRKSIITDGEGALEFFKEITIIYDYVVDNFTINMQTIDKMEANLASERNSERAYETNKRFFEILRAKNRTLLSSKKKLEILIILSEFQLGGGEITGLRLANYLANDHNVYLYAAKPDFSEHFLEMISPNLNIIGNDAQKLSALLRSGKIAIVNSHIWWADKLAYSLLKENNIFWILSMHGCYEMLLENPNVDPEFNKIYHSMYARANYITYDTQRNLKALTLIADDVLLAKSQQIYHGYAGGKLLDSISRTNLGLDEDSFVFVFVARGIKEKGWEEAISATINLKNEGHNVSLLLIGDSLYVQKLRKKYDTLSFIKFIGKKSNLLDYFNIADCGLLPTYFVSESQPLTIIEYLSAGLPVIATDIGEIKHMLNLDGMKAGITLSLEAGHFLHVELQKNMQELLLNRKKYVELQHATKIVFDAKFDMGKFSQAYLNLYSA